MLKIWEGGGDRNVGQNRKNNACGVPKLSEIDFPPVLEYQSLTLGSFFLPISSISFFLFCLGFVCFSPSVVFHFHCLSFCLTGPFLCPFSVSLVS